MHYSITICIKHLEDDSGGKIYKVIFITLHTHLYNL